MNKLDQWLDDKLCAAFDWNERTIHLQVIAAFAVCVALLIWL